MVVLADTGRFRLGISRGGTGFVGALPASCDRVTLARGVPGGGGYNPGLPPSDPGDPSGGFCSGDMLCPYWASRAGVVPAWRAADVLAYNLPVLAKATDTRAWEVTQPPTRREQLRARAVAEIPRWYSPWGHLAFPSVVGLGLIAASIALLDHPTPLELLVVPLVLVLVNLNEWHVHRNVLHCRTWPLEILFWRHTPEHHVIFVRDDMAIRASEEFRLVLIPFYGILAIFLSALPITAALWFYVSHNVALLWVASTMGYVVAYEWLHLAYHLPDSNPIGRNPLIGWLRRHHAIHHTPELMQRWNFNVTVPFADWLLGTIHPD